MKKVITIWIAIGLSTAGMAQSAATTATSSHGWQLKDKEVDGFYGISLDQAYRFVQQKNRQPKTIVVAVIDSGVDTTHEDLRAVLWHNPKEIPGNGIDDDHNGYTDDVYGWNFLGGKDGRSVTDDSFESARVYHHYKDRFRQIADPSTLPKEDQALYIMWKRAEKKVTEGVDTAQLRRLENAYNKALQADSVLRPVMKKDTYTGNDLASYESGNDTAVQTARNFFLNLLKANQALEADNQSFLGGFGKYVEGQKKKEDAINDVPEDFRGEIVKDNYADFNDRYYGNNDVMGGDHFHGTHVSGIIAAARGNGTGMDGVADHVRIMMIRAVPSGDEHDKDIALAIRYAVDNGAEIINMSFGKDFSPEKDWVDAAARYAERKGVLLVQAAGNAAEDIDTSGNFPSPLFKDGHTRAHCWITVGASGNPSMGGLVASFSNYGKENVDVFAPGVKIYSTLPGGNVYGDEQGTSMASPVVAGLAAFILSYYPKLSAKQLEYVIEASAVHPDMDVTKPGTHSKARLDALCKTGGIVNAYTAIQLAATLKGERKKKIKD